MSLIEMLRRAYMRTTSLSIAGVGSDSYLRSLYWVWARLYDWSLGWDPAYRANAERLTDAAVREGDRVLDVGIGTGILAEYAAPRTAEYVGIDPSVAMLRHAQRKIAAERWNNVSLREGDARALPFDSGEFDVVLSAFVLPHLEPADKLRALREMLRVLKPGGRLGLFLAQGEAAPLFSRRPELEHLLAEAGASTIEIEDRDHVFRLVLARKPTTL